MHPRIDRLRQTLLSLLLLASVRPAAAKDLETIDLVSAVLGEPRHVEVRLPASYAWATERRYPVLYLLEIGRAHV